MFSWLTGKRRRVGPAAPWDLNNTLIRWSARDPWTIRDSIEGTLILGATGSGKTTGSGRTIALAMLHEGYGGTVLVTKPGEREEWERYVAAAGRSGDLMVLGPGESSGLRFNPLDFELNRKGSGAGLTENVVQLLSTILEVAERNSASGGGREDEGYWRRANRQLCRNVVDLLAMAKGRITVPDLYRAVISAPTSLEQLRSEEWQKKSDCLRWISEAAKRSKSAREEADLELVADYFMVEYPSLSEKTRSVVVSTFTSMVDVLNRGILRDLFGTTTNVTPEDCEAGRIVLIDLPVKTYAEVGLFGQALWKYSFQRSIERRNIDENPRPVFLWADEAQNFVTSYDREFQSTCRSSRVATVLLSQNYSNFLAALGGNEKARAETDSLVANLNTKVFHANGDPVTNQWAASVIGNSRQFLANGSSGYSAEDMAAKRFGTGLFGAVPSSSAGFSETWQPEVQPAAFTRLRTGGPAFGWMVDAIVHRNGRLFRETGKAYLPVTFGQRN